MIKTILILLVGVMLVGCTATKFSGTYTFVSDGNGGFFSIPNYEAIEKVEED